MQDYRKLVVWQRAHRFVIAAYERLAAFPADERYELTSRLRRALVSIPTNLVEGRSRASPRAFAAFIDIATGSAAEVEYLLLLARDLGYLEESAHQRLAREIDGNPSDARRAPPSSRDTRRRTAIPPSLNANGYWLTANP